MNLELFSCSGGMAEGFRRAGVRFDLAFDADPNACDSYEANLGHRPVQMDIRDLLRMAKAELIRWSSSNIDLLVADPPCTPWSRAGKRLGLEDERDMLRITCELIDYLEPRAWMIANVPGLDDSNHWESVVQPVIGGLASDGRYCIDYVSLDAADFGVPQHRRRPFWFGRPKDSPCIRWPEPTHGDASTLRLDGRRPWVTCRQALGHLPLEVLGRPVHVRNKTSLHPCSQADAPGNTVSACQPGNGGAVLLAHARHPPCELNEPARAMCATDGGGATGRVLVLSKGGAVLLANEKHPPSRPDKPALTIPVSQPSNGGSVLEWPWDRPATTITADERIGPPGHHEQSFLSAPVESQDNRPNAIVLSEKAAAILQGFPESWVFSGKTKKARWGQLGQAMPPPLAEAVARCYVAWRERRRLVSDAPLLNAGGRP